MEQEEERRLVSPEIENHVRELFPLTLSPEEYAARQGANWASFSLNQYRYSDEKLDAWVQQLGTIFSTPGRVHECQEAFLTPEELQRVREREQEEF